MIGIALPADGPRHPGGVVAEVQDISEIGGHRPAAASAMAGLSARHWRCRDLDNRRVSQRVGAAAGALAAVARSRPLARGGAALSVRAYFPPADQADAGGSPATGWAKCTATTIRSCVTSPALRSARA